MASQGFPDRRMYRLYRYAWSGLDWIFPPHCGGCGVRGSRFCSNCLRNVRVIQAPICNRCGREVNTAGLCSVCRTRLPEYESLRSYAYFDGPIRSAIHRLKYNSDLALGEILARYLIDIVYEMGWHVDIVIPVPLGHARLSKRGYNQAALLARPVAIAFGLAYRSKALRKIRDTQTQVGLRYAERYQNVDDAFEADPSKVMGMKVLLVDDVITSGATMNECARALNQAGAEKVYAVTLARAQHQSGSD